MSSPQNSNLPNLQAAKSTNLDPEDAIKELEILLHLPKDLAEQRALTWVRAGLYLITPEQVGTAVRLDLDASEVIFKYLHLNNFLVRPLAKSIFQVFWDSVSYYLTDARQLYSVLAANPKIQKILDTSQGRRWVDCCCLNGYTWLYNYVWVY